MNVVNVDERSLSKLMVIGLRNLSFFKFNIRRKVRLVQNLYDESIDKNVVLGYVSKNIHA